MIIVITDIGHKIILITMEMILNLELLASSNAFWWFFWDFYQQHKNNNHKKICEKFARAAPPRVCVMLANKSVMCVTFGDVKVSWWSRLLDTLEQSHNWHFDLKTWKWKTFTEHEFTMFGYHPKCHISIFQFWHFHQFLSQFKITYLATLLVVASVFPH